MTAKNQIEFLEGEKQALKKQKFHTREADFAQRINKLPRLFQHRIAFMQNTIEGFDFLYLEDVLTSLEWAVKIIQIWPNGDFSSLPKEKIDEICGADERMIDWKYFALVMAIAWHNDNPTDFCALNSSMVMEISAPLPILTQPSYVRERDLTVYISSAKCLEIERKFLKPML